MVVCPLSRSRRDHVDIDHLTCWIDHRGINVIFSIFYAGISAISTCVHMYVYMFRLHTNLTRSDSALYNDLLNQDQPTVLYLCNTKESLKYSIRAKIMGSTAYHLMYLCRILPILELREWSISSTVKFSGDPNSNVDPSRLSLNLYSNTFIQTSPINNGKLLR